MDIEQEKSNLQDNDLNVMDFLKMGLANWYWFVLSLLVCVGLAVFYLKRTPNVYTRTASVLIRDDARGGQLASEATAFEDLNMLNVKSSVDNEMLVFKSKNLMVEVARRLHLDISYKVRSGLKELELYTHSPVTLRFPDASESMSFALQVTPLSEKQVRLSDFVEQPDVELSSAPVDAALGDTVQTPIGRVVVTPSRYYTADFFHVPVKVKKSDLQRVASACNQGLQAELANQYATVINLSINDVSPTRAEDILNTLIAVYNEDAINDKNQIAINTSEFINERLIIIEQELGGVDSEIETFKKENRLTDITSEAGMFVEATSRIQAEEATLQNQLSLAQYIRQYLADPAKSADLIPANTGISDVDIEGLIGEYNELLLKRNKLITNSSNRNPVVMDMNNSLDAMRQTIVRTVDNFITGLNIKIQHIRSQESQTARRISAVPSQQKYVLSVERQQKIKESLYLYLLNKREENALSQSITESNARIIDPAAGSNVPIAPDRRMILLAALLAGVAIPALIIWLSIMLDTCVRTRKDVEDRLSIPFLGEIPLKKRQKGKGFAMAVRENSRDSVSEAFRIVRTNMEFMRGETTGGQVVVLTSLNPDSGKTFVSANLAMSLVLTGKRVILVDLDIRKGTLSALFGKWPEGISNYLSGKTDEAEALIHHTDYHPALDLLPNGPIPPNPAELLLSQRLDRLVAQLKERYDYVILDNVPSNMIADAVIVNRVADLTLYVIRAGHMDRRQLPEVERLYQQRKFRNMAVLLNGVKYNRSSYGYYRYGYGYGYGKN